MRCSGFLKSVGSDPDYARLMSRPRKTARERMSEWVLHCEVNQRHIRPSRPTREAALKDACAQLLQGHAVNRIIGPNETINTHDIKKWCARHRPSPPAHNPERRLTETCDFERALLAPQNLPGHPDADARLRATRTPQPNARLRWNAGGRDDRSAKSWRRELKPCTANKAGGSGCFRPLLCSPD